MTQGATGPLATEQALVERLESFAQDDEPISTVLQADERVIARVTDGIYRQPGSALRELISNAYDADATLVRIRTDRPRFARITVDDDGNGMSSAAVLHMLHHIGGSAKRSASGADLGVTSQGDASTSPGGRKLIGKIGIGLFSVAQLTQSFQIITKVENEEFRTVAKIILRRFSDDTPPIDDAEGKYEAGQVLIWRERATDTKSHGTTVILDGVWSQTIETLRSESRWEPIRKMQESEPTSSIRLPPPKFHIGAVSEDDKDTFADLFGSPKLPWSTDDTPLEAFQLLANSVTNPQPPETANPPIEKLFDYYLQMIWELSLWCPLPYVDIHPFDLEIGKARSVYSTIDGSAVDPDANNAFKLRDVFNLGDEVTDPMFRVVIDDLELARPIKVRNFPRTSSAIQIPIVFAGSSHEAFRGVDRELSGGPLRFQAYLVWAPQIRPPDHQGSLVRVHNATGMLFDHDFISFPVAEQTRLAQITCEVFVLEGFDGALNIDRESFNFAHPHAVYLARWLHSVLRRLIATQKRLAAEARQHQNEARTNEAASQAEALVNLAWVRETDDDGSAPPEVIFGKASEDRPQTDVPAFVYDKRSIFQPFTGRGANERAAKWEALIARIAQILAAYSLLDQLTTERQQLLLKEIREQIEVSGL